MDTESPTVSLRKLAQKACDALNKAFEADPAAMHALCADRQLCNNALADHPTIVVHKIPVLPGEPRFAVGMVGIFAGIFQEMGFPCTIASKWSEPDPANEGRRQFQGFDLVDFNSV